jgi:hypothetical protein
MVIAALALTVSPALAGEDDTTTPAPPPAPAPAPAPAPTVEIPKRFQDKLDQLTNEVRRLKQEAASSGSGGGGGGGGSSAGTSSSGTSPTTSTVAQTTTIPQGGVQAGAGGMAQDGSGSMLLPIGLGLIGLTLAGAGGLALRRRYVTE